MRIKSQLFHKRHRSWINEKFLWSSGVMWVISIHTIMQSCVQTGNYEAIARARRHKALTWTRGELGDTILHRSSVFHTHRAACFQKDVMQIVEQNFGLTVESNTRHKSSSSIHHLDRNWQTMQNYNPRLRSGMRLENCLCNFICYIHDKKRKI